MTNILRPALTFTLLLTLMTGIAYPLTVTGLARLLFPFKSTGSLIHDQQGHLLGSSLIGQSFTDPKYFWSRPSATAPYAYNAGSSSGSNLGPSNPALVTAVKSRIDTLKAQDQSAASPVPADLVTASASGLDPHISKAAAEYQIHRVAKARGMNADTVKKRVEQFTEGRQYGILGEPRVNVLLLNLALDGKVVKD